MTDEAGEAVGLFGMVCGHMDDGIERFRVVAKRIIKGAWNGKPVAGHDGNLKPGEAVCWILLPQLRLLIQAAYDSPDGDAVGQQLVQCTGASKTIRAGDEDASSCHASNTQVVGVLTPKVAAVRPLKVEEGFE